MNKKYALLIVTSLILLATAIARAGAKQPLQVVPSIDLSRYAGQWYEIARLPNSFEKDCAGEVTANYTVRTDGRIAVVNRCRKTNGNLLEAQGIARVADKNRPNSFLEVRFAPAVLSFLPFVWGDYQIIDLAEDYSYAMVGRNNRTDLWILSRAPQLDAASYERLVANARRQGFDLSRLQKTRQNGS